MKKNTILALAITLGLLGGATVGAEPTEKQAEPLHFKTLESTDQPQKLTDSIQISGKEPMSIRDGQRRLSTLGYYNQPLSDIQNTEMIRAIRNFQRDSGLEQTGQLDEPTRTLLIQKTDTRYQ